MEDEIVDYPKSLSLEGMKIIMEQMNEKVCQIKIGEKRGIGFFCKIPFPDKNNLLPVLIADHGLYELYELELFWDKKITIIINNEEKELDLENRLISEYPFDGITIIQIKKEDKINKYLELDNNKRSIKSYIGESIYILYSSGNKIKVSYGIIKKI